MTKIDKAVLLAAGRGTRMRELTADLPKPMIKVRGKPILLHIIEGLQAAGIKNFLIIVGYHGDAVRSYFGDGTCFGLQIKYATQVVQDGTGRVVDMARDLVGQSPFVLSYGDILVDPVNYKSIVDLQDDIEAIVSVKQNEDVSKGGAVFVNDRMEVTDIREKSQPGEMTSAWYNAGIYAFRPSIFEWTAKLQPSPRGEYELTDAIRDLAQSGRKVQAFELEGEWADVRDPEVLAPRFVFVLIRPRFAWDVSVRHDRRYAGTGDGTAQRFGCERQGRNRCFLRRRGTSSLPVSGFDRRADWGYDRRCRLARRRVLRRLPQERVVDVLHRIRDRDLAPWRVQERDGEHDQREPDPVETAAHPERLDLGTIAHQHGHRLVRVLARVPDEVDDEQHRDHEEPLRPQPERPRERHARQIAEKERRIAERRQHAADVADQEDEEDDRVFHTPALAVGLQQRTNEEHRGARGADERRQQRADAEEGGVGERRRLQVAREADAARDRVKAGQQHHERDVLLGHSDEGRGPARQIEREDGQPERSGHHELVTVRFPPVWDPERTHGDGEQHEDERRDRVHGGCKAGRHGVTLASDCWG